MKQMDLTAQKFGFLTVLKLHHLKTVYEEKYKRHVTHRYWTCKCDCGKTVVRRTSSLIDKTKVHSCGCQISYKVRQRNQQKLEKYPHYRTLIVRWCKIKERLYNPKSISYPNYGGRGIKMCDEWKNDSFKFYEWSMANGYQKGLFIDRINNNGDYCPENCRWVDRKTQNRNTRKNVFITYDGETHCMSEWAELLGTNLKSFWYQAHKRNKNYAQTIEFFKKRKNL